jgi:nitrite reductase/ring-hydroxylating ferredoxin subunit
VEAARRKIKVSTTRDLTPGNCKVVDADGLALALYNVDGTFYATQNACSHRGGPLGEGILNGCHVICPWHYWKYDVTSGEQCESPQIKLSCYPVTVEGEDIFVEI